MKILITLVILQVLTATSLADHPGDTVEKILKQSSEKTTLKINDDTYIFNINGYGCDCPGLKMPNDLTQHELNHKNENREGGDLYNLAMGIKNPNFQFCTGTNDAQKVFGTEFITGAELPIKITRTIDKRTRKSPFGPGDGIGTKLIHETITVEINNRIVESTAEIYLN